MDNVQERISSIVAEVLGVDEDRVSPDARFREDLEADSLDLVELIMQFEEEFDAEISDEDAQKIETVGQAITYVKGHMG
ncbi:MAG: acyl carrier protein [Aggregatilineales bacterium]